MAFRRKRRYATKRRGVRRPTRRYRTSRRSFRVRTSRPVGSRSVRSRLLVGRVLRPGGTKRPRSTSIYPDPGEPPGFIANAIGQLIPDIAGGVVNGLYQANINRLAERAKYPRSMV